MHMKTHTSTLMNEYRRVCIKSVYVYTIVGHNAATTTAAATAATAADA